MTGAGPPGGPQRAPAGRRAGSAAATALVVGFDRDDAGRAALHVAADLAVRLSARLVVVHAVGLGDYPVDPEGADWERQGQQVLAEERRTVERLLAGHPSGFVYEVRAGGAVDALADAAEEHDALLVVVGSHAAGVGEGLRRLLQGSVSRRLPRRTARPVVVVPPA